MTVDKQGEEKQVREMRQPYVSVQVAAIDSSPGVLKVVERIVVVV